MTLNFRMPPFTILWTMSVTEDLVDRLAALPRLEGVPREELSRLERLVLACEDFQAKETVPASALFIFIGAVPHKDWLGDRVARDERGFILSGSDAPAGGVEAEFHLQNRSPYLLETSLPGVFVAGDVRHGSIKRVASAVGNVCVLAWR